MNCPRITDVRTVLLTGPCSEDPYVLAIRKLRSAAFIEIHTDEGIVGIGETYAGYFCPEIVPEVVSFFKPILVGQNTDDIDVLWERMYACGTFWCRVGLGAIVLCGIEAALWDLKGKLENKPVHELLGGCKYTSLPCYATGGPSNYPLSVLCQKIEHYRKCGFNAVKLGAGRFNRDAGNSTSTDPNAAADCEVEKLAFLRKHFSSDLRIALDAHMNDLPPDMMWGVDTAAAVLRACESFDLLFFEEALPYRNPKDFTHLRQMTSVPVAGGECLTSMIEWATYLDAEAFDIGQPDASFTGSLSTMMAVSSALAQQGCSLAPHSWGAGGSLMQNIHVAFAATNTMIVEVAPDYGPLHRELIGDGLRMRSGRLLPPDKPGLGIELSEQTKQRFPFIPGSGEVVGVPGKFQNDESLLNESRLP